MEIKKVFEKYKLYPIVHRYDFLSKNRFPNQLQWIYELLTFIPILEQTSREEFVFSLPEGFIREIFEQFKQDEEDFFHWNSGVEALLNEKYYSSLIHSLFEEKYIEYTYDETTADVLIFYRDEAERIINENVFLRNRSIEQEKQANVPNELFFMKPFLLIVDRTETIENFIKTVPSDILDLCDRMLIRSSRIQEEYFESNPKNNEDILERINILKEAGSENMKKLFFE